MSLAELKEAVAELKPEELAELAVFVRERDHDAWNCQIDADFAENGRLRPLLEEARTDLHDGRLDDLP